MGDEENSLVTEIGKLVANASSSESAGEVEESSKKSKRRKNKAKVIETTKRIQTETDSLFLVLPQDFAKATIGETGKKIVGKDVLLKLLESQVGTQGRIENELLDSEEFVIKLEKTMENGDVIISVNPSKDTTSKEKSDNLRRSQMLVAVVKEPRPWGSLGSAEEILEGCVIDTRPLIKFEMETSVGKLDRPLSLATRTGDSPHRYTALGPSSRAPPTVRRTRMDAAVQAVPQLKPATAQVEPGLPVNAWTQYVYDLEDAQEASKSIGSELAADYKFSEAEYMEKALDYNEVFNLYTNDYPLLAERDEDKIIPTSVPYALLDAVTDVSSVAGKVVVCVAWHPMITGVMAALYAPYTRALFAKKNVKTESDVFSQNLILLWSLKNTLKPFMILTCPREPTVIKWCPTDENILVAACNSGQVAIWDLNPQWHLKRKPAKKDEGLTRAQKAIFGVLNWPQSGTGDDSIPKVAPTAMSDLTYSHHGAATDIQWMTPYCSLNTDGNYEQVLHNVTLISPVHKKELKVKDKEFSMQLATCGLDGSILIWDLSVVPPEADKLAKIAKREEETKMYKRHNSRFKFYHRLMKPIYKFIPTISTRKTKLIFTVLEMDHFVMDYQLCEDRSEGSDSYGYGSVYAPVFAANKTDALPDRSVWLGTEDALILMARWEGFAFDKGEDVNAESAEVVAWCSSIHDGPVVGLQRSQVLPELLVSVGGNVWVVWSTERPAYPVVYRRSSARLTCGAWSLVRPSMFYITRTDGTFEAWDWLHRSDRPMLEQSLSGQPLTALSPGLRALPDGRYVFAVGDNRNALNFYFAPGHLMGSNTKAISGMRDAMNRELEVRAKYENWNRQYLKQHEAAKPKVTADVEEKETRKSVKKEVDFTRKLEAAEDKKFAKSRKAKDLPAHGDGKMLSILLQKKNLNKEELMAKREPLRRLQQVDEDKKERHKEKVKHQHEEYLKTVAALLPDTTEVVDVDKDSDEALQREVKELVQQAMAAWQAPDTVSNEMLEKATNEIVFDRRKVLVEGGARRSDVDATLYSNRARDERFEVRRKTWLVNPPSPPPPITPTPAPSSKTSHPGLALCQSAHEKHSRNS